MKPNRFYLLLMSVLFVFLWTLPGVCGENVSSLELDAISAQTNDDESAEAGEAGNTMEDAQQAAKLKLIQAQMGGLAHALAGMPDPPDMSSQIMVPLVEIQNKEKKQERG